MPHVEAVRERATRSDDRSAPHASAIRQHQQQTWAAGDFSMVAVASTIVGERLCESIDVRAGQHVLDVATGSGNTALAAARRGCEVTGVDFVPALLERGRERAAAERLRVRFCEGDAECLPFPEASFDIVLSTFGVMFAPDHEQTARELLRVCRPGGKLGLTTWPPDGFIGEMQRTYARYAPAPPESKPPALWGTEGRLRELLGEGVVALTTARQTLVMRSASIDHWMEFSRNYFGPLRRLLESLDDATQRSVVREVTEIARRFNRSGDETMAVPAEYLEVVAVRR